MQKFWWPGYETQLVGELQRQQNSAQFCDTLLQTEGISVPTHSCVLAALSPYLCRRLSASPSPPSGQKRRLQLQAVSSQTLLKLVGLLYSGELEVRSGDEQNDVLAAAHRFGIGHLVLGRKDEWVNGGEPPCRRQRAGNGVEIGAEETRRRRRGLKTQDAQVQAEKNRRRENGVPVKTKSFVSVGTQTVTAGVTSALSSDPAGQTPERPSPVGLRPQSVVPNKPLGRSSCPSVHCESSGAAGATNTSLIRDSRSQQDVSKQASDGDGTFVPNDRKERREEKMANGPTAADQPREVGRDQEIPEEERNSAEKSRSGGKSLEKMKWMEASKTSVKVRLRRRTEEEEAAAWEVVTLQDKDRTPLVLKQSGSNPEMPQRDLRGAQTSASSVLPAQSPETPTLRPVVASSPTPGHGGEQDVEALREPQGSLEEPDEEVDRMLDEIMMGLYILPNLSNDCQRAQTGCDGAQNFCQVPGPASGAESAHVHGAVGGAGCVFYQNLGIQSDHSAAGVGWENSSCKILAKFCNSVAEDASLYPQTTGPTLPPACVPDEPELHFPGLQPLSSHRDRTVLHFLPPPREEEPQAERSLSSPRINVSRLPRPLSPIEPRSPDARREPRPNKTSVNPEHNVQPSLHRRPWLTKAPWSLHFPLVTLAGDRGRSSPQDSVAGCDAEQRRVGWTPGDGGSRAESGGGANERRSKSQPEEKSVPKVRKRKPPPAGDGAASKKSSKGFLQDPLGRYLESKMSNFCSVSLSSNNVLARERKRTTDPPNKPRRFSEKMSQLSTEEPSVEDKTRTVGGLGSERTLIRTRSFLKRSQEKRSESVPKKRALIPSDRRAAVQQEQGVAVPKRRRGRPRKVKPDQPRLHDGPAKTETRTCGEQRASSQVETSAAGRKKGRKASEAEKNRSAEENGDRKDLEMRKQSLTVTMQEIQKLIKQQTKKSTGNCKTNEKQAGEEERGTPNGLNREVETKEGVKIQDADKSHDDLCKSAAAQGSKSQQDGSAGQETTCDEDDGSGDVLEAGATETSPEKEQLLKNPDEGALCWTGGSDEVRPATSNETEPHCDAKLPQMTPKDLSWKTSPALSGVDGLGVASGCHREEEEDGEEEEVDVLVFSPGKGPSITACVDGLSSMVTISGDEDEDEDDIDVTG